MRWFRSFFRGDPEALERAKQADVDAGRRLEAAEARLEKAQATSRWAKGALQSDGFADALVSIMRGGTP